MASHTNGSTRRGFLSVVTVGVGAAIGGTVALPAVAGAIAPAAGEATFRPVSLGPVDGFTAESGFDPTAAPYVEDPGQPLVSSGLAYVHHTGGGSRDWLAPDAMFVVFSNRCTRRRVPSPGDGTGFACPCHGSQFDQQGARIAGPAVRALDRFQWRSGPTGTCGSPSAGASSSRETARHPVKSPGQPSRASFPTTADILYPPVTYTHGEAPKAG